MKSILVASDMSARSLRAIERAFALAREHDARVHLLSVIDNALPDSLADGLAEEVNTTLQVQAKALSPDSPEIHSVEAVTGDPSAAILEAAERRGADLVVLGLHRSRRLMDFIRETTMERMVRHSHVPVLLVRNDPKGAYGRVLCPVDFSASAAAAVGAARQLAPNAQFNLFHAYHVPHTRHGDLADEEAPFLRHIKAEYQAWVADRPDLLPLHEPDFVEGGLEAVFEQKMARHRPDLIAIGAHSRPPLTRMLIGSFAAILIRNPPADLLISHP